MKLALRRSRPALALLLLVGALVGGPAGNAVAAAAPACGTPDGGETVCITAFTLDPATVDSVTGGTVTITMTLSVPGLDSVLVSYWLGSGTAAATLGPVEGDPATFRGTMTVEPNSRVGTFSPEAVLVGIPGASSHLEIKDLATSDTPGELTITGRADTEGPVATSLSVSGTRVDVTNGPQALDVELRAHDDWAGISELDIYAYYEPAPGTHPQHWQGWGEYVVADVHLVEGDTMAGVWRGPLTIPAGTSGTWRLAIGMRDAWANYRTVDSAALAAAGMPSTVTSTTTAPPQRPTLTGRTETVLLCCPRVRFDARVSWTLPAASPKASGVRVVSASAACGTQSSNTLNSWIYYYDRTITAPCTVELRLLNAAGESPSASVTFW